MKMFGSGMGAIVSLSMALLVHTALANEAATGEDLGSLCDFCATASKRPSMAQTQEMLKRANPGEKFGSEINERHEFCANKVVDMDLKRYCVARFGQLAEFCADNLGRVVSLEMDQKLLDAVYNAYAGEAKLYVGKLERLGEDLEKYFRKHGSFYLNPSTSKHCEEFTRQFETVQAILDHSGQDFLRLAKVKGLENLFGMREFCNAFISYRSESNQDED